ncbi:MAG: hypothetical protein RL518_1600 [Pseudomonadota bacterium]|jgi:hypothetical protein
MSSDNSSHKRSGLAGQIEVEIVKDSSPSDDIPYLSSQSNPLSILQELVEQAEELQSTVSECRSELLSSTQRQQNLIQFQKQNSAFRKMLHKMLDKVN